METTLKQFGKILQDICEKLTTYPKADNEILQLPGLGEVPLSAIDLLLQFFWRITFSMPSGNICVNILLSSEEQVHYLLTMENGSLQKFSSIPESQGSFQISVQVDVLQENFAHGWEYLLFSLLKGDGLEFSENPPVWMQWAKKVFIRPKSLKKVIAWLFPFSGVGFLLKFPNAYIKMIFYGGHLPRLRIIEEKEISQLRIATKNFRHFSQLAMAFGVDVAFFSQWMQKHLEFIDFVSAYGQSWVVSVPLEVDDLLQHAPQILELLPAHTQNFARSLGRKKILELLKKYWENLQRYLSEHNIFLKLRDEHEEIILKISGIDIQEVYDIIPAPEDTFTLQVEAFSTMIAWLNEKSLRLLVQFLDAVMPPAFLEKILREETLMLLELERDNQKYYLHLSGSRYTLEENGWQGDFSLLLLHQNNIVFQENHLDTFIITNSENNCCTVHFPLDSNLQGESIVFRHAKHDRFATGIAQTLSETSVFSQITPGIRGNVTFGVVDSRHIQLNQQRYQISQGRLLRLNSTGRLLNYKTKLQYITHLWLTQTEGGAIIDGKILNGAASRWEKVLESLEMAAISYQDKAIQRLTREQCHLPQINVQGIVGMDDCLTEVTGKTSSILTKSKKFGFHAIGGFFRIRFEIVCAWVVPADTKGNFMIRLRCVAKTKEQLGLSVIEFPCALPKALEPMAPCALDITKTRETISFTIQNILVFSIQRKHYARIFSPRWDIKSWLKKWMISWRIPG